MLTNCMFSTSNEAPLELLEFFDGISVGIALLDRELRYIHVNDHLAKMQGMPPGDYVGRRISELIPERFPSIEKEFN